MELDGGREGMWEEEEEKERGQTLLLTEVTRWGLWVKRRRGGPGETGYNVEARVSGQGSTFKQVFIKILH